MKAEVVKIKDGDVKVVATLKVDRREIRNSFWSWLSKFEKSSAEAAFGVPIKSLGISQYTKSAGVISTYRSGSDGSVFRRNSAILSGQISDTGAITQKDPVILADGTTSDFLAGFDFYEEGYVVSTGTIGCNIFGTRHDQYVGSITPKRIRYGSLESAKIFSNLKGLKEWIEKNEDFLHYFAENNGFSYDFHPISRYFEEEVKEEEEKSWKKKTSNNVNREDIRYLLSRINKTDESEGDSELRSLKLAESPEKEAETRMKELGLMEDVVKKFRNGDMLVSEFGGILFDPDDDAKKAIDETKDYGLPYHVVKSVTNVGVMYAVLFVSKYRDEWGHEHYDKKSHTILANVYNKDMDLCEIGLIGVEPVNGGLIRTM